MLPGGLRGYLVQLYFMHKEIGVPIKVHSVMGEEEKALAFTKLSDKEKPVQNEVLLATNLFCFASSSILVTSLIA